MSPNFSADRSTVRRRAARSISRHSSATISPSLDHARQLHELAPFHGVLQQRAQRRQHVVDGLRCALSQRQLQPLHLFVGDRVETLRYCGKGLKNRRLPAAIGTSPSRPLSLRDLLAHGSQRAIERSLRKRASPERVPDLPDLANSVRVTSTSAFSFVKTTSRSSMTSVPVKWIGLPARSSPPARLIDTSNGSDGLDTRTTN